MSLVGGGRKNIFFNYLMEMFIAKLFLNQFFIFLFRDSYCLHKNTLSQPEKPSQTIGADTCFPHKIIEMSLSRLSPQMFSFLSEEANHLFSEPLGKYHCKGFIYLICHVLILICHVLISLSSVFQAHSQALLTRRSPRLRQPLPTLAPYLQRKPRRLVPLADGCDGSALPHYAYRALFYENIESQAVPSFTISCPFSKLTLLTTLPIFYNIKRRKTLNRSRFLSNLMSSMFPPLFPYLINSGCLCPFRRLQQCKRLIDINNECAALAVKF